MTTLKKCYKMSLKKQTNICRLFHYAEVLNSTEEIPRFVNLKPLLKYGTAYSNIQKLPSPQNYKIRFQKPEEFAFSIPLL